MGFHDLFETRDRSPGYGRTLRLCTIEDDRSRKLVFLQDSFLWVKLHWQGKHEVRHVKEPEMCPHCEVGLAIKWKAFIAVVESQRSNSTVRLLQITPEGGEGFEKANASRGGFRGMIVCARRKHGHKRSPLLLDYDSTIRDASRLPSAEKLDEMVKDTLMTFWCKALLQTKG